MSKTLLKAEDVPTYIQEVVRNLRLITDYKDGDIPGYTFELYGKFDTPTAYAMGILDSTFTASVQSTKVLRELHKRLEFLPVPVCPTVLIYVKQPVFVLLPFAEPVKAIILWVLLVIFSYITAFIIYRIPVFGKYILYMR